MFRGCRKLAGLNLSGRIFSNEKFRQHIHQKVTFPVYSEFFCRTTQILCFSVFSNAYIVLLLCVSLCGTLKFLMLLFPPSNRNTLLCVMISVLLDQAFNKGKIQSVIYFWFREYPTDIN